MLDVIKVILEFNHSIWNLILEENFLLLHFLATPSIPAEHKSIIKGK